MKCAILDSGRNIFLRMDYTFTVGQIGFSIGSQDVFYFICIKSCLYLKPGLIPFSQSPFCQESHPVCMDRKGESLATCKLYHSIMLQSSVKISAGVMLRLNTVHPAVALCYNPNQQIF